MELLLSRGPFAVWIQGHPSASFSRNYKRVWSSCFSHTPQNYSIVKYLKATSRNQRTLHLVDKQLPVDEACCQFGSYVKLLCTCRIEQQPSTSRSLSNAFTILMSNQAALSRRRLPDRIDARHKITYSMIWSDMWLMLALWYNANNVICGGYFIPRGSSPYQKNSSCSHFLKTCPTPVELCLKNLLFQIPFHLCVSLITTVMIRLSHCTIPLIFHSYVFTVQWRLEQLTYRWLLSDLCCCFGSRDPINKWSSVLCCVKCCFLYAMTTSCVLWP